MHYLDPSIDLEVQLGLKVNITAAVYELKLMME